MSADAALVVDASVAVKWIFDEPESEAANRLRERDLLAPEFIMLECGSVIWRRVTSGGLAPGVVPDLLAALRLVPVRFARVEALLDHALELAFRLRHPIYDCVYLALAMANDLQVVTADRRFARAAQAEPGLRGHVVALAELAH